MKYIETLALSPRLMPLPPLYWMGPTQHKALLHPWSVSPPINAFTAACNIPPTLSSPITTKNKKKASSPAAHLLLLLIYSYLIYIYSLMGKLCLHIFLLILTNSLISGVYSSAAFTFVNKCAFTVWPGILSNAGIAPLPTTGFSLQTGESKVINAPSSWGGRFWGRTHCSVDSTGKFSCVTGDCGSGKTECAGGVGATPVTLAEFTLNGDAGKDFYDVSLVDGFNLPMMVVPQGGSGANCTNTGCVGDLNSQCPPDLRVTSASGERVACKNACEAFGKDEYCCSGAYGTPQACQPTQYSQLFKSACPHAYSYAYDDSTSTFTCTGTDYTITFCPSPNTSQKSSSGEQNPGSGENSDSSINSSMVYEGALDVSRAPPSTCAHVLGGTVAIATAIWLLRHLF